MKKWGVLILLAMSMFIIVIDTTIMNVSISALVADLDTTVGGIQSAISIYALVMASLILTGGKLADIIGQKKTFTIGLILFGIGTSTAALSQSLGMLIIGWSVIEGIGSALMLPNTQTILRKEYDGNDRAFGYAIIGAVSAVGAALGPIIGGYLTTFHTWRYAFAFEVAIVVTVLLFRNLIKSDVLEKIKPKFDFIGAILSFLGLSSIVLGFLLVQSYGLFVAKKPLEIGGLSIAPFGLSVVPFMIGLGILIIMILFSWESNQEKNNKDPLFRPSIFTNSFFKKGVVIDLFRLAMTAGLLFTFPLFLQVTYEYNAMQTGIALMPFSVAVLVMSLIGARFASKIKSKRLIQFGFILTAIGTLYLAQSIDPDNSSRIIPSTIIIGSGIGLIASQIINLVLSVVDEKQTAVAAGLDGTFQQLGNSIGVALIGTILFGTLTTSSIQGVQSSTLPESVKNQIESRQNTGIQLITDSDLVKAISDAGLTEQESDELVSIYDESRTTAFQSAVLFIAFISFAGLILTPGLPDKKLTS